MKNQILRALAPALFLIAAPSLYAGGPGGKTTTPATGEPKAPPSAFDELWGFATLYKNDANPVIQELKLRGRYQGQYARVDADQGDFDDWENRRSRIGFDAKLFNRKIEIRLDAQSNDRFDPFYDRLVDAYIKWKPSDQFSLTVGRQKPQIGYFDFVQSTNTQPTFERSQIFNQLRVDRATGVLAEGKSGNWTWQAGVYSNDVNREFGQFDGGWSWGAGIGYDFRKSWGLEKADWRLDWIHSDHQLLDTVFNRYDDIVSSTLWIRQKPWSLVTELFYATGDRASDVFGFYVQPTWDLVPQKLQLVARYSYSNGDGPDSVFAQSRYERSVPLSGGGRGSEYHAGYLGLQYFIYGDKLKLMAGAEYGHLDGGGNGGDYDGLTVLTGVRLSF